MASIPSRSWRRRFRLGAHRPARLPCAPMWHSAAAPRQVGRARVRHSRPLRRGVARVLPGRASLERGPRRAGPARRCGRAGAFAVAALDGSPACPRLLVVARQFAAGAGPLGAGAGGGLRRRQPCVVFGAVPGPCGGQCAGRSGSGLGRAASLKPGTAPAARMAVRPHASAPAVVAAPGMVCLWSRACCATCACAGRIFGRRRSRPSNLWPTCPRTVAMHLC